MTFSLPSGLFNDYYRVCDELLSNEYTSELCTLVYPPKKVACDCPTLANGGTNNVTNFGGPSSFFNNSCSTCGGQGYKEVANAENIRLRLDFDVKAWRREAESLDIADASVKVIGSIVNISKIQRANRIEIIIQEDGYGTQSYALAGSPNLHGFGKDRYFFAFLKKI